MLLEKENCFLRWSVSLIFGPFLIVAEEVQYFFRIDLLYIPKKVTKNRLKRFFDKFDRVRREEKKLEHIRRLNKSFQTLCSDDKQMIRNYFVFYEDILNRRTFLVNQEARMQLVLQNVLILYQVRNIFISLGKHEKLST